MADGKQATAVPRMETLAYFTTNDTRPTSGIPNSAPAPARLSSSERYRRRAESLATAGRVHGVNSIQHATAVLQALPADVKLVKVFFIGHGFDDGFFFHGQPDPNDPDNFSADSNDETLQDPAKLTDSGEKTAQEQFIAELIKHLHPTEQIEIGLLSCYTGTGSTVRAIGRPIRAAGFSEYKVGSYRNFYESRYIFASNTGRILEWTDRILDRDDPTNVLVRMHNNQIPPYETECGESNDPLAFLPRC